MRSQMDVAVSVPSFTAAVKSLSFAEVESLSDWRAALTHAIASGGWLCVSSPHAGASGSPHFPREFIEMIAAYLLPSIHHMLACEKWFVAGCLNRIQPPEMEAGSDFSFAYEINPTADLTLPPQLIDPEAVTVITPAIVWAALSPHAFVALVRRCTRRRYDTRQDVSEPARDDVTHNAVALRLDAFVGWAVAGAEPNEPVVIRALTSRYQYRRRFVTDQHIWIGSDATGGGGGGGSLSLRFRDVSSTDYDRFVYAADYSPGRSSCRVAGASRKCGRTIPAHSLRLSRETPVSHEPGSYAHAAYHAQCVFRAQRRLLPADRIGSVFDIAGYDRLTAADQQMLWELIAAPPTE